LHAAPDHGALACCSAGARRRRWARSTPITLTARAEILETRSGRLACGRRRRTREVRARARFVQSCPGPRARVLDGAFLSSGEWIT
jgi:hypothetical protein